MQNNLVQKYIDLYSANQDLICKNLGTTVNDARSEALKNFNIKGISNLNSNKYKHIDIQKIFSYEYRKYFTPPTVHDSTCIFSCKVSELDSYKIFLINGFYFATDEHLNTITDGMLYCGFAQPSNQYQNTVETY